MLKCAQCGAGCSPDDRFCGECGASLASASAGSPEPKPEPVPQPADTAPKATSAGLSKGVVVALFIGAILAAGVVVKLARDYITGSSRTSSIERAVQQNKAEQEAQRRFAEKNDFTSDDARKLLDELDQPKESEAAEREPDAEPEAAETVVNEAEEARSATPSAAPIMAGSWSFQWQITHVAGDGYATPATPMDRFPINRTGSERRCISQSNAQSPRSIAFPMDPRARCRATDYSMTNGSVYGSFACNIPNTSQTAEAAIEGTYSATNVDVTLRMFMPARDVASGGAENEMVHVFYRYRGSRAGSC